MHEPVRITGSCIGWRMTSFAESLPPTLFVNLEKNKGHDFFKKPLANANSDKYVRRHSHRRIGGEFKGLTLYTKGNSSLSEHSM